MNPFEMLKNLGNLNGLKEQLEQTQEKLSTITATGSAGGNMVNVTLNGKFELVDIHLDPICVDNRDSRPGHPVFNRSVSLKDGFKKK